VVVEDGVGSPGIGGSDEVSSVGFAVGVEAGVGVVSVVVVA
jgi:hypothetical protein